MPRTDGERPFHRQKCRTTGVARSKHSDRAADAAVKKKIALTAKEFTWLLLWYIGRGKSIPPAVKTLDKHYRTPTPWAGFEAQKSSA